MSLTIYIAKDSAAISVGADETANQIAREAEKRDVEIQLVRTGSYGLFWLEPFVVVETGSGKDKKTIGYGPVQAEDVASLVGAAFIESTDHPLCVGPVEQLPYLNKQNRQLFARVGRMGPLDLNAYGDLNGLVALKKTLDMSPETIIEEVLNSGLRGRGGAGFPAGIKWRTVAEQSATQKYICCNADEGDSGTFADRMLMEGDPFSLLEGMIIAGIATGATKGLIYVRSEYPAAIATLKSAIIIMEQANWLGENIDGSKHAFHIEVRRGAGSYVCGEESAMLESLEGKRGQVRVKPPIPAISGLFGKPTLVHNVLTLASAVNVIADGAAAYKDLGVGRSTGTQAFQLGGNIKHGGLVEVPFGITLRELIEEYGGGTATGHPFKCAQIGGPLGAYVDASMLDVVMGYEELAAAGAMLGHGGVVVFDDQTDMAQMAKFAFEFCAIESCGKCTPCRIGAIRGVETMDKIIAGKNQEQNLDLVEDLCAVMEEGSLCAMGGLTPLPVRSAIRLFPNEFGVQK